VNLSKQMNLFYQDVTPDSILRNLSEPPRLLVDTAPGRRLIDKRYGDRLSN
jgi:hypothetical protein